MQVVFMKRRHSLFFFPPPSAITTPNLSRTSHKHLSILNDRGLKTLGVLDVHGLDERVELLLGALLVVTLPADADTDAEGNALDAVFPDLLVQLGVEADIGGTLLKQSEAGERMVSAWVDVHRVYPQGCR